MRAFIFTFENGKGSLTLGEVPKPVPQPDEVLIQVKAIDINPVDQKTFQGKGQYQNIKNDSPMILGWDVSGIITEVGSAVKTFRAGDEVFGLVCFPGHGRTYAEYVSSPAAQLALKPEQISHEIAVATTLSALTAYQALEAAQIKNGERVLIQGAAGGVGYFAVQIAKLMGAYVIGTATPDDQHDLNEAGLDELINYRKQDFSAVVSQLDFVLDTLGGAAIEKAFNVLNPGGRLITLPSGGDASWKKIAAEKNIDARHLFVHSSDEGMEVLAGWLASGKIKPNIAHFFRFEEIPRVHELMAHWKLSGKIVVTSSAT